MSEPQMRIKPDSDVVFTQLDNNDAVLLHLGTQAYYTLNPTGALIWQLLEKGLDVCQIGSELESRFEVSLDEAKQSVTDLAAELTEQQLVSLQSD